MGVKNSWKFKKKKRLNSPPPKKKKYYEVDNKNFYNSFQYF